MVLLFNEINASSLIKVNMAGEKLTESPYRVNGAGIVLHSGVYIGRSDVMGVMHTHTESGVAFSMLKCDLLPLSTAAMRFHKRLGYFRYTGHPDDPNNRLSLAQALGLHMAVITEKPRLDQRRAYDRRIDQLLAIVLEQAITAQLRAMSTGAELEIPEDEELLDRAADKTQARIERNNNNEENWLTLLRLADSLDPSFRQ